MNVLYLSTTVTNTQPAPIIMDLSCALVRVDILEMELFAKVINYMMLICTSTEPFINTGQGYTY